MLVLTRRPGESIVITTPAGERIEVTVLGQKGNQVRIGTDAPADFSILREELLDRLTPSVSVYGITDIAGHPNCPTLYQ